MRRNLTYVLLGALILLLSATVLSASGLQEVEEGEEAGETVKEPITVEAAALKGPSGFGIIKMLDEKPDLGEGVDTNFRVLPTPKEMVARVAGGDIDVGLFPSNMAAKMYTEGPGYKLGAVVGMGVLSVLSRDDEIKSWEDLKGRTIHSIGKGATPDYLLSYLLSQHGLKPGEDVAIDFSITNGAQLTQMLIAGKVENAVLPQPFVTLATKKAADVKAVLDFQESWKEVQGSEETYPITVVVFRPELAEKRPEVVRAFLDEYRASIQWVNANPAEAAQLIEKHDVMPAAIAQPAIPHCNLKFIPAAEAVGMMEEYLQVLLDFNPASVGGSLPDADFYFQN